MLQDRGKGFGIFLSFLFSLIFTKGVPSVIVTVIEVYYGFVQVVNTYILSRLRNLNFSVLDGVARQFQVEKD